MIGYRQTGDTEMNAFGKQQTIETIRSNLEGQQAVWDMTTEEQREANRLEYAAEKTRRYKLSLIRKWREKK